MRAGEVAAEGQGDALGWLRVRQRQEGVGQEGPQPALGDTPEIRPCNLKSATIYSLCGLWHRGLSPACVPILSTGVLNIQYQHWGRVLSI